MPELGQCSACKGRVSNEASACPYCGQPQPWVPVPSVGTVHRGVVVEIFERAAAVTLSSGFVGILYSDPGVISKLHLGDSIEGRFTKVQAISAELNFAH